MKRLKQFATNLTPLGFQIDIYAKKIEPPAKKRKLNGACALTPDESGDELECEIKEVTWAKRKKLIRQIKRFFHVHRNEKVICDCCYGSTYSHEFKFTEERACCDKCEGTGKIYLNDVKFDGKSFIYDV